MKRRTRFDLEKAQAREHIVLGLLIAIANIDEVVKIIKNSQSTQDAKRNLMKTFELTTIQAQAILDMRLARLAALEVEKLQEELTVLQKLISKLKGILRSNSKLLNVIKKELLEQKELLSIRIKNLDKQETSFGDVAKSLQEKIMKNLDSE